MSVSEMSEMSAEDEMPRLREGSLILQKNYTYQIVRIDNGYLFIDNKNVKKFVPTISEMLKAFERKIKDEFSQELTDEGENI